MIKIKFDLNKNPIPPTLILATRNGNKLGAIEAADIDVKDSLEESCEMNFKVYKETNGVRSQVWDDLTNFKLVWWKEQDAWFDATVEFNDDEETVKTVFCTQLGQSELSLINLYNYEINTEADILSPTYNANFPTILYRPDRPQASLLHRLLEKAPHYSIAHVDDSIKNIQRTYSFNGTSIYDALQQVAEDIGAFVKFSPIDGVDSHGRVLRQIAFYDAMYYCNDCRERHEFLTADGKCPNCGSSNIADGYGEDTTIFITKDELATSIGLSADTDAVRNCYRLTAGDDLMNATIRNINANGSDYMWYLEGDSTADMSDELKAKLTEYNADYADALKATYAVSQTMPDQSGQQVDLATEYNRLVAKYRSSYVDYIKYAYSITDVPAKKALNTISSDGTGIKTYKKLVWLYYDTIDFELFVKSALLPTAAFDKEATTPQRQARKIKSKVTKVGVTSLKNVADSTINNAVMEMVNATLFPGYTAKIVESSVRKSSTSATWTGRLTITKQGYEEESYTMSESWSVAVTDDYEEFVLLKIKRTTAQGKTGAISVEDLFELNLADFKTGIQSYSLDELSNMQKIAQGAVDIITEQGLDDTWAAGGTLYDLYADYYNKLSALDEEMNLREYELAVITNMQILLQDHMNNVKHQMNLENYLGDDLWAELSMFRREDEYSNSNYISDGMTNKEICNAAQEFMDKAEASARNAMENQYNINTSLNNLLQYDKYLPWTNYFAVGNWMRVLADRRVYKLRLLDYSINFSDFSTIDVNFSEAVRVGKSSVGSIKTLQEMIDSATKTVTVTNTIDVSSQFTSVLNDTATVAAIAQTASSASESSGARNLLMDTNAPSLAKEYAEHPRYFSTTTNNYVTPTYFRLTTTPPINVQYGAKFVTSTTSDEGARGLAWYSGGTVGLVNGEKYTLSCYARVASGTSMVLWFAYSLTSTRSKRYTVTSTTWKKFSWTFTYDSSSVGDTGGTGARVYVGCAPTYIGTLETCGYQLERGNTSSDYQRSPEDSSGEANAHATTIVNHLDQKLMARYGICATAAGTAAKTVAINNFELQEGSMVAVRFINANTVASPTLNVSSTGAHLIRLNRKLVPAPEATKSYTSTSSDGTTKTVTNANNKPSSGWVASSLVHLIYTKGTGSDSTHDIANTYYWDIIDTAALTKIDNILTQNIVGTNSYINLAQGQFDFGKGRLLFNGTDMELKGKIFTEAGGNLAGWDIGTNAITKLVTSGSDTYQAIIQAPSETQGGHAAFGIKKTDSNGNETWPFAVHYNGNCEMTGKITAYTGNVGGWSIGSTLLQKYTPETDDMTSGDQYNVFLQAPSSITPSSTRAIGVQKRTFTSGTPGSWSNVFHIRYDGHLFAKDASITGEINATSGTLGDMTVNGTLTGENVVIKIPNTGTISSDGFKVLNNSGSLVFGVLPNAPTGTVNTYRTAFNGGLTGDNISVTNLRATGSIYEGGTLLSSKYNPLISIVARASAASYPESTNRVASGTATHNLGWIDTRNMSGQYLLYVTVRFASNSTGRRVVWLATSNTGDAMDLASVDTKNAISGTTTYLRIVKLVDITSTTASIFINGYQNSGSELEYDIRYGMAKLK